MAYPPITERWTFQNRELLAREHGYWPMFATYHAREEPQWFANAIEAGELIYCAGCEVWNKGKKADKHTPHYHVKEAHAPSAAAQGTVER